MSKDPFIECDHCAKEARYFFTASMTLGFNLDFALCAEHEDNEDFKESVTAISKRQYLLQQIKQAL